MLRSLRKSVAILVASFALAVVPMVALSADASAQTDNTIQNNLKCGSTLDVTKSGSECASSTTDGAKKVNDMITTVVNIFSVLVGVVSVIMIIWGGFKYVTSGGDSGNVSAAKNTIIYAVVGLVVVALAQFIVQFVLEKVTGSN